jgi:DNA recombination protein RmuC
MVLKCVGFLPSLNGDDYQKLFDNVEASYLTAMDTATLLLLLFVGLTTGLLGYLAAWAYLRQRWTEAYVLRTDVERDYVRREVHEQLRSDADLQYENLQERTESEAGLRAELAAERARIAHLRERQSEQESEMQRLQEASHAHFERTAERLFREKSDRFATENAKQLSGLLTPLRDRIQTYEQQIHQRFVEETKDRSMLREEIRRLQELNQRIGSEASNLAGALRGSNKVQGDWGEWQLLTLLEASGLERGIHFNAQASYRDSNGRQKRPDFIINLPEDKHLVIDCKVSLTAYERFCALDENEREARELACQSHLRSLRSHVADLAGKNYTQLYQINSPDYLLLFVPIEPALGLALTTDNQIFLEALNKHIVLVSPSTLLATLRTVGYIWKQENQKKNVLEIARQSGLLYDGFVNFTNELQKVGHRLDQAQQSYHSAVNKLHTGGKYGATLVGRAERLRKLGARTKKRIDGRFLEEE